LQVLSNIRGRKQKFKNACNSSKIVQQPERLSGTLKDYYEITIRASDESREAIMNKMIEMGSLGFVERGGAAVAYFEESAGVTKLCNGLRAFRGVLESSGLNPAFSFDYVLLPGKDWSESWKEGLDAFNVGENITIAPSWINHETDRITTPAWSLVQVIMRRPGGVS
jgi:ribosomal protein L11 methylase PrmA